MHTAIGRRVRRPGSEPDRTRLLIDNSNGADTRFASDLQAAVIAKTVRETEARRPSEHRRFRDVPIYAGESSRVLTWVDVFD